MTITKFTEPYAIEYLDHGTWYLWKQVPSKRVAEIEVANRANKGSACRILPASRSTAQRPTGAIGEF
jgi:hypothetical protein